MSNQIKERNEIEEQYKWDLSGLFENDEAWEKSLQELDDYIAEAKEYEGKLGNKECLLEYLYKQNKGSILMGNLFTYAHCRMSEDMRDMQVASMQARAYSLYAKISAITSFAIPEILALDEEVVKGFIADDDFKEYAFLLQDLLRQKEHMLNASEEKIMATLSEALMSSRQTSSALMETDLKFNKVKDSEGNEHDLSNSTFVLLQNSLDRTLRKNAFLEFYKAYKEHAYTFAATYNGNVKASTAIAKVRNYPSSRAMAMDIDNIPESVYDNLIETVHEHMDLMHRYVALRKRILGVDELHYYDVYTPLAGASSKTYTYDEAKEVILEALKPMGEEYSSFVRSAFKDRWIDVYPNVGKVSGAYSSGSYESNPFILTNFTGTLDSVSTIAHEMGHSMHSYHTHKAQPQHYSDYTMFVAEVASTVNENLFIEHLLENEHEAKNRLALLNQYMEGFKGTVYRQTMFAEFEKEAHAMVEREEPLNPESLCNLYEKLIQQYFGEELVMDEEIKYEWERIPHFYRPFYVYVYATGYSTAVALSEKILKEGESAVKAYREFLSMGSSQYPLDELRHAGVDLSTKEPIEKALAKFSWVLDEAEKVATELGY
ncbi:MAG: oligoendopeptidase F [Solobacterium sp.]|nr:oligoendopeptidase F [Solobacterium sp.]